MKNDRPAALPRSGMHFLLCLKEAVPNQVRKKVV